MSRQPIVYANAVPSGIGQNPSGKPERANAPPVRSQGCFANMQSVNDLNASCAMAPADHMLITESIKAMGKIRAEDKAGMRPKRTRVIEATHTMGFTTGATVRVIKGENSGRKGIIIKAQAGHTKKSHTPVHRLSTKDGRHVWLEKQTHLTIIY